jgi:hypothetical protein
MQVARGEYRRSVGSISRRGSSRSDLPMNKAVGWGAAVGEGADIQGAEDGEEENEEARACREKKVGGEGATKGDGGMKAGP